MYVAFSKYGQIVLGGEDSEVEYSNFKWGVMISTSTMAADIVFYAMIEWALYAQRILSWRTGSVQNGRPYSHYSTGDQLHGASTSCLRWPLDLCCIIVK